MVEIFIVNITLTTADVPSDIQLMFTKNTKMLTIV